MAKARAPRKKKLPGKRGDQTRRFTVRSHSRSPRGPNAGKPRVRVRKYHRGRPRRLPG